MGQHTVFRKKRLTRNTHTSRGWNWRLINKERLTYTWKRIRLNWGSRKWTSSETQKLNGNSQDWGGTRRQCIYKVIVADSVIMSSNCITTTDVRRRRPSKSWSGNDELCSERKGEKITFAVENIIWAFPMQQNHADNITRGENIFPLGEFRNLNRLVINGAIKRSQSIVTTPIPLHHQRHDALVECNSYAQLCLRS